MNTILHIITGLEGGGAEGALFRLCANDTVHHHHVISLTSKGVYGPLLEAHGVEVTALHLSRRSLNVGGLVKLWRCVRSTRPMAVQTWMYHADLLGGCIARLAGCENVFWGIRHTDLIGGKSAGTTIAIARLSAKLSKIVPRKIICCAHRAVKVHKELGYDESRMVVIPNGYDLGVYGPDPTARMEIRRKLDIHGVRPVIGFMARFNPQKDHANLFSALAILKEQGVTPICVLAGKDMDSNNGELMALLEMEGMRLADLRLLGYRTDAPDIFNALDLHVMSSSYGEAFPNVLAEAMACGVPCVSTNVGDAALIIGKTGWIVPPRQPNDLAAAINEALGCMAEENWSTRCRAARAHVVEHFSIKRMIEQFRSAWAPPTPMN